MIDKKFENGYGILKGANYFDKDGSQNYLLYYPVFTYFQTFISTDKMFAWNSERLLWEAFKTPATFGNSSAPKQTFYS